VLTEAEKLREARDFSARELQKQGAGRLEAMSWSPEMEDQWEKNLREYNGNILWELRYE
jgi:hypothetical protein